LSAKVIGEILRAVEEGERQLILSLAHALTEDERPSNAARTLLAIHWAMTNVSGMQSSLSEHHTQTAFLLEQVRKLSSASAEIARKIETFILLSSSRFQ
jgi:oligoribonuclease (3'-5' exoribonuclease)